MKHPLVSIIIPNYNHAPFLDERINSILNQRYDNYELIILDDMSTDNSVEVINKYKDHVRVSDVVVNEQNSGSPFKQWEKGFAKAKGELIWIAESDDTCKHDFLETLVREFEQDDTCVLAFCRSVKIDVEGKRLSEDGFSKDFRVDGISFIKKDLSRFNYIVNASSAIFAKRALEGMDKSYTGFRGCGDWIFWVEVAKCGRVSYINKPLNYFRQHGSNTTADQTRTGKGELEVVEVTNYMKDKRLIGWMDFYRAAVVHVYSVKYGKQSRILSDEIMNAIFCKWEGGCLVNLVVKILYYMDKWGIHIINR